MTTTATGTNDKAVNGRRCGFPVSAARPAAIQNSRRLQLAFDPLTGKYRLAIR